MKLTPVECLPRKAQEKCKQKNLMKFLDEFMRSGALVSRVDFDGSDYLTIRDCAHSLTQAVLIYKYPITVACRCGEVYLVRK
jgi:hypothetical protein